MLTRATCGCPSQHVPLARDIRAVHDCIRSVPATAAPRSLTTNNLVSGHRRGARICRSHEQQRASATADAGADNAYSYSDPLNRFLGNFLPRARDAAAELAHVDFDVPKARGIALEQLKARLEALLAEREWFVTGEVEPALFSDDFKFQDESVAAAGVRTYALGVRKLFDQDTCRAELVAVETDPAAPAVVVTWRLEGRVNLPGRPRIPPYVVTTTLDLDADGLICRQTDEFSVPGWRLLAGALLGPWAGPPPAPPVEQLRAQHAAGMAPKKL